MQNNEKNSKVIGQPPVFGSSDGSVYKLIYSLIHFTYLLIVGNADLLLDDIFDEFLFSSDRRGTNSNDIVNSRSTGEGDQRGTHLLAYALTFILIH
jgi:hypothetical protein